MTKKRVVVKILRTRWGQVDENSYNSIKKYLSRQKKKVEQHHPQVGDSRTSSIQGS